MDKEDSSELSGWMKEVCGSPIYVMLNVDFQGGCSLKPCYTKCVPQPPISISAQTYGIRISF